MTSALIGHTGFVGGFLSGLERFDLLIHRANVDWLRRRSLDRVVCAGLPAAKWIANREPNADRANMLLLCDTLRTVTAGSFVLISTIDVYPRIQDADEEFDCGAAPNHPYGRHRLEFEQFVRERFPHALILRLPALFGPGLRKNVLFDLMTGNQLEKVNPASSFQWYPLERLPEDIERAQRHELRLANLFTEPLATGAIVERCFPDVELGLGAQAQPAVHYDLQTRYAHVFGGAGRYVMSAASALDAIGSFCGVPA
ncbi:MAG: NAD-dependent epimerase/dehydratase family protein [Gammaproteobacteria bacterium]|nr:NAD-dependent epimerase/dehydratase family protein [Gammaproteobacteria bacterium]